MAKKTVYFEKLCGYSVAAVTEDKKLTLFNFEKEKQSSVVGNIYKGEVVRVLPGMQAAFVDCGLERNCYLSADDCLPDTSKYDGENGEVPFPDLKEGDAVMVQVVKPPISKKGAKVTLFPSFVGKSVIYMPGNPYVGVSRKIADDELRRSLAYTAKRLIPEGDGIILRTASPYVKPDKIVAEIESLKLMHRGVREAFKKANKGDLLFAEIGLLRRVMRDALPDEVEKIIVGDSRIEKLIRGFLELTGAPVPPITVHDGATDMLESYGVAEQIARITSPCVDLENGAQLVIDRCEALTAIDVNTGKFTGEDSLERTVYYTNILAAREIARQVALRDIGGIVVVDFIDMDSAVHQKAIVEELESALRQHSPKCSVGQMSQFGLVEFTRKRTGVSITDLICKPCRHCRQGYIKSPRFTLFTMRAKLQSLYADGVRRIQVDLNDEVLRELNEWQDFRNDLNNILEGAELYCIPHRTYSDEQINYRCGQDITALPAKAVKIV